MPFHISFIYPNPPALKVNSNRSKVLEIISSLRAERRRLIAQSEAMRRKYESIRAYSKVSSLPVGLCSIAWPAQPA